MSRVKLKKNPSPQCDIMCHFSTPPPPPPYLNTYFLNDPFSFLFPRIPSKLSFVGLCSVLLGEGSTARNSSARKNCSTPKSRLLDTVWADDKNILICSKIKKVCRTCHVEQMQVLDQNEQLLELHLLNKRLKNINCSTIF